MDHFLAYSRRQDYWICYSKHNSEISSVQSGDTMLPDTIIQKGNLVYKNSNIFDSTFSDSEYFSQISCLSQGRGGERKKRKKNKKKK